MRSSKRLVPICALITGCGSGLGEPWPEGPPAIYEEPATETPASDEVADKPPEIPPPERLGTPETSRAAAPRWFTEQVNWGAGKQQGYAPQGDVALRDILFKRANLTGARPALEQALVACEFRVGSFQDSNVWERAFTPGNSKADLVALAKVGAWEMLAHGRGEAASVVVTFPLLPLKTGTKLTVVLADRDIISFTAIERLEATYPGKLPWRIVGEDSAGECRAVSREVVEALLPQQLQKADQSLETASKCKPELNDFSLGRSCIDGAGSHPARHGVEGPASLVGWDDPRVRPRSERLDRVEAAFDAAVAQLMQSAELIVPPASVADGQLQVSKAHYDCNHRLQAQLQLKVGACVVFVELKNLGPTPIDVGSDQLGSLKHVTLIGGRGYRHPTRVVGVFNKRWRRFDRDTKLLPGRKVRLAFSADAKLPEPLALRGSRTSTVRTLESTKKVRFADALELQPVGIRCGDAVVEELKPVVHWNDREELAASRCAFEARVTSLLSQATSWAQDGFGPLRALNLVQRGAVATRVEGKKLRLRVVARKGKRGWEELHWAGDEKSEFQPKREETMVFFIDAADAHQNPPRLDDLALLVAYDDAQRDYIRVSR